MSVQPFVPDRQADERAPVACENEVFEDFEFPVCEFHFAVGRQAYVHVIVINQFSPQSFKLSEKNSVAACETAAQCARSGLAIDTVASRQADASAQKMQAAKESIKNDPNVHQLMEMFDATVEADSVKPLKQQGK